MRRNFYYKGNIVGCMSFVRGSSELNPKTCFCCEKEICDGESVTLLINNCVSFPNVLLHQACFKKWENKTDELCGDLEESYNRYKQLESVFG